LYSVGAGFSTDLGPNGRLGYVDRRINDKGHQFEGKLFASPVISELNFTYRWPKKDPRREWFSIVSGFKHEKTDTSEQDSFKLGFRRSKNLGNKWLQTRYVDYLYEDFTIADQNSSSQLIIFGSNWETARGRALSRAASGFRLNMDVSGAAQALGSDTSFLQLLLKTKWVRSLGSHTRFLARATAGMTMKDKLSDLPASVRFFAGGDNSVRGYAFQSLGPVDQDGEVIGGSNQLDVSLEIDRLFGAHWAIAAFIDSGDAFDEADIELSTGVGVGLRWYSPVGQLRLDFAHPLDNPAENFRIHISLGPDL
jgi:translocation and assembly module TamA